MENEYYGIATTHTDDYLAHYGVKGMKWGVRRALDRNNDRALGRQYRKAQKKLAKLEKQAANGKKYAKRAAALGVGAAAAGGLAAAGTEGVGMAIRKGGVLASKGGRVLGQGMENIGNALYRTGVRPLQKIGHPMRMSGQAIRKGSHSAAIGTARKASDAVRAWGNSTSITKGVGRAVGNTQLSTGASKALVKATGSNMPGWGEKIKKTGITNNTIARAGAAAVGAGLAGAAGYNAYRAATTKKAARKAAEFRREMNKAFAGTKYGRSNGGNRQGKKRRR